MNEERPYFFNLHRGRGRTILCLRVMASSRAEAERRLRKHLKAEHGSELNLHYHGDE